MVVKANESGREFFGCQLEVPDNVVKAKKVPQDLVARNKIEAGHVLSFTKLALLRRVLGRGDQLGVCVGALPAVGASWREVDRLLGEARAALDVVEKSQKADAEKARGTDIAEESPELATAAGEKEAYGVLNVGNSGASADGKKKTTRAINFDELMGM